jgi:integrase
MLRRFSLAWESWPARERHFWLQSVLPRCEYVTAEQGEFLSEASIHGVCEAFSLWLAFLIRTNRYSHDLCILEHASDGVIAAFVDDLLSRRGPLSVKGELMRLSTCFRLAFGKQAHGLFRPAIQRVAVLLRSAPRAHRKVADSADLFSLGISLVESALHDELQHRETALRYRDGLIIALLAARPIRAANLASMMVGKHLVARGDAYWLSFDAFETKTHVPIHVAVPRLLSTYISTYLSAVRTKISVRNALHEWVWCGIRGDRLSTQMIYTRIVRHTREGLGTPTSPHRFRHAAATKQALVDPAHVTDGYFLLGHSSYHATEKSYNLASTNDGAQKLAERLLARRKQLAS